MREAAIERPRGAVRARQVKVSPAKRGLLRICVDPAARLFRRHPGKALATTACAALMAGIAGNAILLQKGRHPAPLFGTASSGSVRPVAAAPMPQSRPRPASAEPAPAAPVVPPPATMAARPAAAEPAPVGTAAPTVSRVAHRTEPRGAAPHPSAPKLDGITRLLEGRPAPAAAPEPKETSVVAAQKALGRLGYAVKPDGFLGKATREALTKFQQDRHLGGNGTLSPTLLHALEHAAGSSRG